MQHCYTSVHTSLISSSPPRRLPSIRAGSCYPIPMHISASLRRRDDRHYWWSQRVICPCPANYSPTLACPLQSANAFSLWVLRRQVWMQLQLDHRFWISVTGARLWKRVPHNRILLNNLNFHGKYHQAFIRVCIYRLFQVNTERTTHRHRERDSHYFQLLPWWNNNKTHPLNRHNQWWLLKINNNEQHMHDK